MHNRFRNLSGALIASAAILFGSFHLGVAQAAPSEPQGEKDWTLLVWMNGKNSLDSFTTSNLNDMEKIGSTKNINVVVQWGSLAAKTTKRVFVTKDTDTVNVTSPVIEDMGKVDMGDWKQLVEFVKWGMKNYPAKHYFIDMWDHGSGWHTKSLEFQPLDVSWDEETGTHMTTLDLSKAIKESAVAIGHKVDIFASDACLMAMAEIANEMKNAVDVYAGSEEVEPARGWPYDEWLGEWDMLTDATPRQVATILTEKYVSSYMGGSGGTHDVVFSAFDMSKIEAFNASIKQLGKEIQAMSKAEQKKILGAAQSTQTFTYSDYNDVGDFIDRAEKAGVPALNKSTISSVKDTLGTFVIANKVTSHYSTAKGVSMWIPHNTSSYKQYIDLYKGLAFDADTGWGSAVKSLVESGATPALD